MAPTKKRKKKPAGNPARGFATVSMPSKKAEAVSPEQIEVTEIISTNVQPSKSGIEGDHPAGLEPGASDLRNMAPDELEQHLEEAELQSLLDIHRQRSKRDAGRQIARLQTERRSLRRADVMLETESWLPQVRDEILELARASLPDTTSFNKSEDQLDETDLCVKLWTVKQILEALHFRNVDGALKHLINFSSIISKPASSSSVVWGLDEAQHWLAFHSQPDDLPEYNELNLRSHSATPQPRTPASDCASGELSRFLNRLQRSNRFVRVLTFHR
jgi:ATP-dependent RNA helicase DHX29